MEINAHQLNNACHNTLTWAQPPGVPTLVPSDSFTVQLDDNGNANAVVWGGPSCAATTDLITADLTVPPYTTARTHVVIKPPADTTPGLKAYPKSLVEDSVTSSVAAIFYTEFPSYDSQQQVTFSDDQLYNQCHGNIYWYSWRRSSSPRAPSRRAPRSTTTATPSSSRSAARRARVATPSARSN